MEVDLIDNNDVDYLWVFPTGGSCVALSRIFNALIFDIRSKGVNDRLFAEFYAFYLELKKVYGEDDFGFKVAEIQLDKIIMEALIFFYVNGRRVEVNYIMDRIHVKIFGW